jgi:hypothetical protein
LHVKEALKDKIEGWDSDYFPVMTQVSPTKDTLVGVGTIQHYRNRWSEEVNSASKVAIIGVKPNPVDFHVLEPIRATTAEIFYIGSKQDFACWALANSNFNFVSETFEEGFDELLEVLTRP